MPEKPIDQNPDFLSAQISYENQEPNYLEDNMEQSLETLAEKLASDAMKFHPQKIKDIIADLYYQKIQLGKELFELIDHNLISRNELLRNIVNFYLENNGFEKIKGESQSILHPLFEDILQSFKQLNSTTLE